MNDSLFSSRFMIGTYILSENAWTESHIKDMKRCGIDLLFCVDYDRKLLDLLEKYDIGAVVRGVVPWWFGSRGENAGTMSTKNPPDLYCKAAESFVDHPAVWGIFVADEPSQLDLPYIGRVINDIEELFPNQFGYLNLYPSYGMVAANSKPQIINELGTDDYQQYIRSYCLNTDTKYLSFDHYVFSSEPSRFLEDLRICANACREFKRELWVVLQVNSQCANTYLSVEDLLFQAFCAMAFGAVSVMWSCYSPGWWHNNILDKYGRKTQQYDKLMCVNKRIRNFADTYMDYRWVDSVKLQDETKLSAWGDFINICLAGSADLILGLFTAKNNNNRKAIVTCVADVAHKKGAVLQFQSLTGRSIRFHEGNESRLLLPDEYGWYRIPLESCIGGMLTSDTN